VTSRAISSFWRPRDAVAFTRRPSKALFGVRAVGSFLPGLTRKAFERYGFSAATLVMDWPHIAGRDLASHTAPERLKWPRHGEEGGGEAPEKGRQGATLVLRVDGARALEVQYQAAQIIERINAYFGYAAVAQLRVVQAPIKVPSSVAIPPPVRAAPPPLTQEVADIADPALRGALARLGASVRAAR
jgi:hypothetical protein